MTEKSPASLIQAARECLRVEWNRVLQSEPSKERALSVPSEIVEAIGRSINSSTLTYRYVLPTQILAKAVDPSLDCRSIQASCGLPGAFDARSLCHEVVVEFDRRNSDVLGGSKEPYLNNPLRIPSITQQFRYAQKNKEGFDDLRAVLQYLESHKNAAPRLLSAILRATRERLATLSIVYPIPNRISLKQSTELTREYLGERTGGVRLQAVTVALFRCVGEYFGIFSLVESANINAADASTGSAADLECKDETGHVVMAVEVKDRQLTLRHAQDKLPNIRSKGIRELLFLVQEGIISQDLEPVNSLIDREFVTGQNIYVCEFREFLRSCLVLLGESGRRIFLQYIGEELEKQRLDISHRKKWCSLLETL